MKRTPGGDYYLKICLFGCKPYSDIKGDPTALEVRDGETTTVAMDS